MMVVRNTETAKGNTNLNSSSHSTDLYLKTNNHVIILISGSNIYTQRKNNGLKIYDGEHGCLMTFKLKGGNKLVRLHTGQLCHVGNLN